MKKIASIAVVLIILLACFAAYYYSSQTPPVKPEPVKVQAPPPAPEPIVRQIIAPPLPAAAPLPKLTESDSYVIDTLTTLINNKYLMRFFNTKQFIHKIVATIDNLPRRRVPRRVMPMRPVAGKFITSGEDENLIISRKNAARYRPYVHIIQSLDSKKAVELYVHLYPLFQQAYEDLGYPKKYFNDRLLVVLGNLLVTPNIKEPVRLVQPSMSYKFADINLEKRSIGQRIIMRMGRKNEARTKAWLTEVKQELMLHMHEMPKAD
ncbi:MAG: DUF3014 domain-containing protein [Gallionella sp.]